jgi:hypothetical protein
MSEDTNTLVVASAFTVSSVAAGPPSFWLFRRSSVTGLWTQDGQPYSHPTLTGSGDFATRLVGTSDLSKIVVGGRLHLTYYALENAAYVVKQDIVAPGGSSWGVHGLAMTPDASRLFVNDPDVPLDPNTHAAIGSVYMWQLDSHSDTFSAVPGNITVTDAVAQYHVRFGNAMAVSTDGSKLVVGGPGDDSYTGLFDGFKF